MQTLVRYVHNLSFVMVLLVMGLIGLACATQPASPTSTLARTPTPTPITIATPTPPPTPPLIPPTPKPKSKSKPTPTEEGPIPTPASIPTKEPPTSTQARPTPTVKPTALPPVVDFTTSTSYAPFPEVLQSAFSAALNSEFRSALPRMGISAAVYQNGKLWSEAAGMANDSTPMTTATPIGVKSSSKIFLSALILSQI